MVNLEATVERVGYKVGEEEGKISGELDSPDPLSRKKSASDKAEK